MEQELIDRTALLAEIEHGENKSTIYDRADWILECIKKAPVVYEKKRQIQAGQRVYVITKKKFNTYEEMIGHSSELYEIVECYVLKNTARPNEIFKYHVHGHYSNGSLYESTITSRSIGVTIFTDKKEAEESLKKKNRRVKNK